MNRFQKFINKIIKTFPHIREAKQTMTKDSETLQGLKNYTSNKHYKQALNAKDKDELAQIKLALIEEAFYADNFSVETALVLDAIRGQGHLIKQKELTERFNGVD